MKKINLVILMIVIGISVYSMDTSALVEIKIMEKEIEKIFIKVHSQMPNGEEMINCEVDINLFEKSGLIRVIGKNVVGINELIEKSESGFFDEYFKGVADIIRNKVKNEDYEVILIFVSEKENELIARRYYII